MHFAWGGTPVLWRAAATLSLAALLGPIAAPIRGRPSPPLPRSTGCRRRPPRRARKTASSAIGLYRQAVGAAPFVAGRLVVPGRAALRPEPVS